VDQSSPRFIRCRQDYYAVNAPIRFPILPSVVECESQKEDVWPISADFAPKIGCHGNVPRNQYQTEHLHQNVYTTSENLVKIGLVVSDICLLQAIVKKERKKRKESNRGIT